MTYEIAISNLLLFVIIYVGIFATTRFETFKFIVDLLRCKVCQLRHSRHNVHKFDVYYTYFILQTQLQI